MLTRKASKIIQEKVTPGRVQETENPSQKSKSSSNSKKITQKLSSNKLSSKSSRKSSSKSSSKSGSKTSSQKIQESPTFSTPQIDHNNNLVDLKVQQSSFVEVDTPNDKTQNDLIPPPDIFRK